MEIFILIMVFVLGLCGGSFVNMLIYRVAINYKLESKKFKVKSKNRSFCDYCGRQLKWYENIPVISWIIQKEESRCCHKKLSVLYPVVELATGILLVIVVVKFNLLSGEYPVWVELVRIFWGGLLVTLLVFLTIFDFKYLILPDFAVIILIIISFLGVVVDESNIIPYLFSAAGAAGFLGLLHLITKGKGMGIGDVKLAVFMGFFLGWPNIAVAFYIAFVTGALVGLVGIILKKIKRKTQISFGPFLILGTLVAWFWGKQIFNLSVFQIFR